MNFKKVTILIPEDDYRKFLASRGEFYGCSPEAQSWNPEEEIGRTLSWDMCMYLNEWDVRIEDVD